VYNSNNLSLFGSISAEVIDLIVANGVAYLLVDRVSHISQLFYVVTHFLLLTQLSIKLVLMVVLQNVILTRSILFLNLFEVVHHSTHRLLIH